MMEEKISQLLSGIVHPESGKNIVDSGIVREVGAGGDKITVTLEFPKAKDPFSRKIVRSVEQIIESEFPSYSGKIEIDVSPKPAQVPTQPDKSIPGVRKIIAVSSGKGGVGKSTVAYHLARALARAGYKTGILDADIYGPSQPLLAGLEGYVPAAVGEKDRELMVPAENDNVKIMSIGFFVGDNDALIWRGPMATSALRQMIRQTRWEELDYLVVDLPPGTGDIHLTILQELRTDGAVIVTTPEKTALADVVRGIAMFRSENVSIPVIGIIENMSWFTPAELPESRYYIFGKNGGEDLARREGIPLLAQIPLVMKESDAEHDGGPAPVPQRIFDKMAHEIVDKLG